MNQTEHEQPMGSDMPDDLNNPDNLIFHAAASPSMKTTSNPNSPSASSTGGSYDQLLAIAQAAQAAADRAVSDLAAVKRTLSEAPRVLQVRKEELERARQGLAAAEADYNVARDQVMARQSEAARLIEIAADAQRALAQALITQDVMTSPGAVESLTSRLAVANAQAKGTSPAPRAYAPAPSPATLGTNRYTPMPSMHPADLHAEVVEYLRERDALCPSCGHSLRAIQTARCPGCKLQLSLNVLQSVRAHPLTASTGIWIVRFLSAFSIIMAAYLTLVIASGTRPIGCGGGSDCHLIIRSPWSKIFSIPVAAFAIPVHLAVIASSLFLRVGLADTTRRKGWTMLSLTSLIAGLAGLWFIGVQLTVFQSVCPHCLLVNLAGIVGAAIVLKKAPLGRLERLPEPAIGRIEVPKRSVWSLVIASVVAIALFAGVQTAMSTSKGPMNRNQILGIPEKNPQDENGLLMKGLEAITPLEKNPTNDEPKAPPTTIEKAAPATGTPKTDAGKAAEPVTPKDVIVTPPTSAGDAAAKLKEKEPEQAKGEEKKEEPSKGLLLPGLDLAPPAK